VRIQPFLVLKAHKVQPDLPALILLSPALLAPLVPTLLCLAHRAKLAHRALPVLTPLCRVHKALPVPIRLCQARRVHKAK
jgi:hypothetical protein